MSTRQRALRGEGVTEFTGIVRKWKRVEQYHDFRSNGSSKPFGYRWESPKEDAYNESIEKESAPKRRRLVHVSALSRQQEPPNNHPGGVEQKPATIQTSSKKLKLKILSKPL
ncbi:hypothetical protein PSENEW3_00002535 [Picochlorum sp. SENEW3]|nr:hypothetical protein PSENEW3_00002535 [Picochlorum sp. SENEW3]